MKGVERVSERSRRALCIGVGRFVAPETDGADEPDLPRFEDLDYAAEYTSALHAALQGAGYDSALAVEPAELGHRQLGERVEQHLAGGGVAVVHVLSHGDHTPDGGVYVVGSDAQRSRRTRVEDWRIAVTDDESAPMTLFLLDLCHAGAANRYWQPPVSAAREKAWVIAAAAAGTPTYAGRLTRAATVVINEITSGAVDLAPTVRAVGFDVLFERICKQVRVLTLAEGGHLQDPVATPVMGAQPEVPFFPNPRYRPHPAADAATDVEPATAPFLDPALDEAHFRDRVTGHGPAAGRVTGGCFTGRAPQLRRLVAWMDGDRPGGLRVVTGSPGAGTSALLGLLVCAAHPRLRRSTQQLWRAAAARPSENADLAAVHARQRTLPTILRSLVAQLNLDVGDSELTPARVVDALTRRPRPPVVVVDAVDEAPDHQQLVAQLLIPLARARRADGAPACRLLIGMRPWREFASLLDLARHIGEVIDLNRIPIEQRRHDVAGYVTGLLELLPGYATATCRGGRRAFATAVAATLVPDHSLAVLAGGEREVRWGEFLVAALYTHTVSLHDPQRLADPASAALLGADVPRTLPEVLELDLADRPPSRWRRAVLTALAHARGAGIPRRVLAAVAAAVVGGPASPTVEQVGMELDALRFYLRTSADADGSALYRVFHQGLADHLRDGNDGDPVTIPGRVLDGLLATVPVGHGVRRWDLAEPYLLRHAVQHAADAHRVDELLVDPGFLAHADPTTLIPCLHAAQGADARLAAAVYRASAGEHPRRSTVERRTVLAVDAARYGALDLLDRLHSGADGSRSRWRPRWASGGQVSTALRATLTGHTGNVGAVACTMLDGRPVAVSGCGWDGTVRVWDLVAGAALGGPLVGHIGSVGAVACTTVGGRPVAVSGGADGTVRVWDLGSGAALGAPLVGHAGSVGAVACTVVAGRPVAVSGSRDGSVRIWDLATRTLVGSPLAGHTGRVRAVTCTLHDGRPIAVSGGKDGSVRVWDLAARTLVGGPLVGHTGKVNAVACTVLDGRPVVVSGGKDGSVRVWDLGARTAVGGPLAGHTGDVDAVACTVVDGRPVVVSGGGDRSVRVWDLATRTPTGGPLVGHTGRVRAVACAVLEGRSVAVSGGWDGSVRVWDLGAGTPVGSPLAGHTGDVDAVACAVVEKRPVVVSGGADGAVRVWDLGAGTLIGDPLAGHTGRVRSVACTVLGGRPVAVSGGWDGSVRVWDLGAGAPVGSPLAGHTGDVDAVACTVVEGRPVVVSGGWDGSVWVWDLGVGAPVGGPLTGHTGNVGAVACTVLAGRPVAVSGGGDGSVRVWDLATRTPVGGPLTGHTGDVGAVACTVLAGRPVAVSGGGDGSVRVWDLATRTPVGAPLPGHTDRVRVVACTVLDGRPVAFSAGGDRAVRVWDLAARAQVDRIDLPAEAGAMDVTPTGQLVAAFGWDLVCLEWTAGRQR